MFNIRKLFFLTCLTKWSKDKIKFIGVSLKQKSRQFRKLTAHFPGREKMKVRKKGEKIDPSLLKLGSSSSVFWKTPSSQRKLTPDTAKSKAATNFKCAFLTSWTSSSWRFLKYQTRWESKNGITYAWASKSSAKAFESCWSTLSVDGVPHIFFYLVKIDLHKFLNNLSKYIYFFKYVNLIIWDGLSFDQDDKSIMLVRFLILVAAYVGSPNSK